MTVTTSSETRAKRSPLRRLQVRPSDLFDLVADEAGGNGVPRVQVGQAALLGQMTTGFPVSPLTPATFPVVSLARVGLGDHQRLAIPCLFGTSVVMTLAGVAFGFFPV